MQLTKRQKIYTAIVVVAVIIIANITNRPKPYTGVMGVNGGDTYEVVVKELSERGFKPSPYGNSKFVNAEGHTTHWTSRDKWEQIELKFTKTNKLKSITLTKWNKLEYAPSLIKELEKTFGDIQGDDKTYNGNDFFLFGKPWKTHASLNATDNPPFATVTIEYDIKD